MTDNGSAYRAKTFAAACRRHGLKHLFTRPYTPRTNGKAERFIQTALRQVELRHGLSDLRRTDRRPAPVAAPIQLASPTPASRHAHISRLGLPDNNLLRLHS